MIPPQDAVSRAKKYLLEHHSQDNITDLRLEEVEFIESEMLWSITLGLFRSLPKMNNTENDIGEIFYPLETDSSGLNHRIYK